MTNPAVFLQGELSVVSVDSQINPVKILKLKRIHFGSNIGYRANWVQETLHSELNGGFL